MYHLQRIAFFSRITSGKAVLGLNLKSFGRDDIYLPYLIETSHGFFEPKHVPLNGEIMSIGLPKQYYKTVLLSLCYMFTIRNRGEYDQLEIVSPTNIESTTKIIFATDKVIIPNEGIIISSVDEEESTHSIIADLILHITGEF